MARRVSEAKQALFRDKARALDVAVAPVLASRDLRIAMSSHEKLHQWVQEDAAIRQAGRSGHRTVRQASPAILS